MCNIYLYCFGMLSLCNFALEKWSKLKWCHSHSSERQTSEFCRAAWSAGRTSHSEPPPPSTLKKKEKKKRKWVSALRPVTSKRHHSVSDLKLVFKEPHVGDSVVHLRQQSFDILHRDADRRRRRRRDENPGAQTNSAWFKNIGLNHQPSASFLNWKRRSEVQHFGIKSSILRLSKS